MKRGTMIETTYWFMLPVGMVIATLAMMSGIGGAVLFTPFFIFVLGMDPLLALALGLLIEVFGFSSGVIGYLRAKTIHFSIVKKLIVYSLPATVVGVFIGHLVSRSLLTLLFSLVLLYLGFNFLLPNVHPVPKHPWFTGKDKKHFFVPKPSTVIKTSTFLGGLLLGMISAGLGEINEYNFLKKMKLKPSSAAGTSVFLVASSALVGVISHLILFFETGYTEIFSQVAAIVVFVVPGVIIGAQLGVRLSQQISLKYMGNVIGVLFVTLSTITLASSFI